MISTVLIEDDVNIRKGLAILLGQIAPDLEIVAQAGTVQEGLSLIEKHQPSVLFLDIQLTDGSSFDILDQLVKKYDKISAQIVFITAYQEYAIKAFKFSALDYLIKPIDPEELQKAIAKIRVLHQTQVQYSQIDLLLEYFAKNKQPKKIVLSTAEGTHLIDLKDIIRCESMDNYTKFFLKNEKPILISKTLKEYDELLKDSGFERIHQSHLINLKYLKSYIKTDGGYVIMTDNSELPVSQRKREHLQEILKKYNEF